MGLLKLLKLYVGFVIVGLHLTESAVVIRFSRTPPARTRFTTAVFRYSVADRSGRRLCETPGCSMHCELDGKALSSCSFSFTIFKNLTANYNHHFLLNFTTSSGERNSSAYNWYIDTTPPTASIFSEERFTNAASITVGVVFSEACTGGGGFKCLNASTCDVTVNGPASIDAATLQIVEPDIKYSMVVVLSPGRLHGRVVIKLANSFCTDQAGNLFTRTDHSILLVHFDRRPVHAKLWTSVPSYKLEIGKVPRTVLATNKVEALKFFLGFSNPIVNSTKDIMNSLNANSGYFIPIPSGIHGNRQFAFELRNVSNSEILTVKVQSESLIGQSGTPVSPVMPIIFLYDTTKPRVVLHTSSRGVTKEPNFNVIVEFTKPVFGFDASGIEVEGGKIARFKELSKALYSLNVLAVSQNVVSVHVPDGKVHDITGNKNSASNQLEVRHYSTPAISVALHSSVTAGLLATSLAAAVLALSSANLAAIGGINDAVTDLVISDPSRNLLGMTGHLQVFVLSDWFSHGLPVEYFETTKGLRWLIPHKKVPWKKEGMSIWPQNRPPFEGRYNLIKYGGGFNPNEKRAHHSIGLSSNCTLSPPQKPKVAVSDAKTPEDFTKHMNRCDFSLVHTEVGPEVGMFHRQQNGSVTDTPHGLPLNSEEYFIYFLRGEPLSAANVIKRMENYTGWQDLEMNLFWFGVGGGSLLIMHLLILLFLRWRTGKSVRGLLSIPRFELFLMILSLPCIGQSAAFVIRGGTTGGIVAGSMLLAVPSALLLSILLFLTIAIFTGSFFQYKEVKHRDKHDPWYRKLTIFLLGKPTIGKWFQWEGTPSSFLERFGILFEDRKGPPMFVSVDMNGPSSMPNWTSSGQSGIGRMRTVRSDDGNEDPRIPISEGLLGCFRSAYIVLDILRRVGLGIISGAYSSPTPSQCILAFGITLVQFLYLFLLKPYIRIGVHLVESVSLLCEACIFALLFYINRSIKLKDRKNIGVAMLALLFVSFVFQLVNEWHALIKCLLRLPQAQKPSFKLGLKCVGKGLILPFLSKRHWCTTEPKTGLVPVVVPLSPEAELENRAINIRGGSYAETSSQMAATVVPVCSPDLPGTAKTAVRTNVGSSPPAGRRATYQTSRAMKEEEKHPKGLKLESKNDMKKLRELARASFSGKYPKSGDGGW